MGELALKLLKTRVELLLLHIHTSGWNLCSSGANQGIPSLAGGIGDQWEESTELRSEKESFGLCYGA